MFMQYFKIGIIVAFLMPFVCFGLHADEKGKKEEGKGHITNTSKTPFVTWNGKDLTVEASEIIDRVVISGESYEVADSVAVISLNPNKGVVDITVETGSGDYDCEVDTGMDGPEAGEQD